VLHTAACSATAGVRAAATTSTTPTETCCKSSPRRGSGATSYDGLGARRTPHDRVDPPCEVRFGETSSYVQPPGPHHRADLVQGVLADRRDEAGRDPSAPRPDSPAAGPVPQEREGRVLMRAAPPGVLASTRSGSCPDAAPARRAALCSASSNIHYSAPSPSP
jgi:hypothetical protein